MNAHELAEGRTMQVGDVWRARWSNRLHLVLYVHHDGHVLVAPLEALEDEGWDDAARLSKMWTYVREVAPGEGECNATG